MFPQKYSSKSSLTVDLRGVTACQPSPTRSADDAAFSVNYFLPVAEDHDNKSVERAQKQLSQVQIRQRAGLDL